MVWSINQEEYQCDGEVGSSTKLNLRLIKSREKKTVLLNNQTIFISLKIIISINNVFY